jgi:hypothetical protein
MIEANEVADVLHVELPEFRHEITRHRQDWGDDPMLYLLAGALFRFVTELPGGRERVLRAQQVYVVTDKMLVEGSPSVRDCFAIEMIEPLISATSVGRYPSLELALGPAGRKKLERMREWWRVHGADVKAATRSWRGTT